MAFGVFVILFIGALTTLIGIVGVAEERGERLGVT
jgi:hypothetical protein